MSLELPVELKKLIEESQTVLVLQPEKPDTDSLGSALALEEILGDLGKEVVMYCQDEIPEYIRVLDGWDRVSDKFPKAFDLSVLVDTGGVQMVERTLEKHGGPLSSRPFIIIDHHGNRTALPFTTIDVIDPTSAATGELIVKIAGQLEWPINERAASAITEAILADTGNLVYSNTTVNTVETVAAMMKKGVDLAELHRRHRAASFLQADLLKFKGKLIERIEYFLDGRLAVAIVSPGELKEYAERHDPSDLVIREMQNVRGVVMAATLRDYGTKIKGSLRANAAVASNTAAHFGGGGHPMAAGFRVEGKGVIEVRDELVKVAAEKIAEYDSKKESESVAAA